MRRVVEQSVFAVAAWCLVSILLAFVSVAGSYHHSDEGSRELVEFGECEALTKRSERRRTRRDQHQAAVQRPALAPVLPSPRACDPSIKPSSERENLNGTGSYLLT